MSDKGGLEAIGRFDLLARAISGRRMSVQVSHDSDLSYWDGRTLFLSAQRLATQPEIWFDVAAQALLLSSGSLRPGILGRLVGRPQVARRYAFLEVIRGVRLAGERLPVAFSLHPALQPGANWLLTCSAEESLRQAASRPLPLDDIPDFIGLLRPALALRNAWEVTGGSALTERERAGELALADPSEEISDDQESESSTLLDRINSQFTAGNPMSQALSQLFGLGRSRSHADGEEQGGGGAELPVGRIEQAWRRGMKALQASLPFTLPELAGQAEDIAWGNRFAEWDYRRGSYRTGWVRVEEVEPWREEGPLDLSKVLLAPGTQLRRQLSTLGREYEMHRRQCDGAEFDIGPLIEHAIELRTGQTPANLDIYRASRRTRSDLGVLVALDISGSTGERDAQGEQVFEQQLRAAWQLAKTLDELGDRVGLYGFHSWGRELACMVRLKGHEEPWSRRVAERCAHLEPCGYTRTGSAVRYAGHILSASMRLPNRLLILITDGLAYDQDYEGEYAREDTRMALRDAQAAGTACVCLCIGGSATAEQLEQVFGSANVLMVDDADQWISRIGEVCKRALSNVRMGRPRANRNTPSKRLSARIARPADRLGS
jgi:Mg-chelatase subunit ChlD